MGESTGSFHSDLIRLSHAVSRDDPVAVRVGKEGEARREEGGGGS